jgi:hypothetical protein
MTESEVEQSTRMTGPIVRTVAVPEKHVSTSQLYVNAISIHLANAFFVKFEHLGNCGLGVWGLT